MKNILYVFILFLSCISVTYSSQDFVLEELHFKPTKNTKQHLNILLVVNSADSSIKPLNKKLNEYILKMNNVSKKVIYFADIPARQIGHMPITHFVKLWKEGICFSKKFIPDAVLVTRKNDKGFKKDIDQTFFALLKSEYHDKNNELTFLVKSINQKNAFIKSDLGSSSLFVYEHCY